MRACERFIVSGQVQGVGFRAATARQAQRLGVCGWVRNQPDGRVEVLAAADTEALDRLAEWLAQGPPSARVSSVERQPAPEQQVPGRFSVR